MNRTTTFVRRATLILMICGGIIASTSSCKQQPAAQSETVDEDSLMIDNVAGVSPEEAAAFAAGSTRIDSADVAERGAEIKAQKKVIFFDLDATLTQHKTPLTEANKQVLDKLGKRYKLLMCGAGNAPRIYKQMNNYPIDILANYGMQESQMIDGKFTIIREDKQPADKEFFDKNCEMLRQKYGYTDYKGEPVEYHESGMVTFGLLGTKASSEDKLAFDPDRAKRRAMYPEVKKIFKDYAIYIGGSTSFDFAPKQYNKYSAIMRYAEEHGYKKEEILFVGDDFDDGGGDSHARLGGLDYIHIYDYTTLPERLAFLTED